MAKVKTASASAVHIMLQGKGGVGKSLASAILAQYLKSQEGANVHCIDTDPVNSTFANYAGLDAKRIDLMDGSKINERRFDELMERLMTESGDFVIDNGASSFIPLSNYLIENDALSMLKESGREVYIHSVITGGQALIDTLTGFKLLAEQTKNPNMVVWLNEFFGDIQHEGKAFTDMRVYEENKSKVRGIIRIAKRNPDTFGKDIEVMATRKMTFSGAIASPDFALMAKQRLKTVQRDLFEQLEAIGF